MYKGVNTSVRTVFQVTSEFPIEVSLHQGSTPSCKSFALIMDYLTVNIQDGAPWCMLFINDVVLISKTRK